MTQRIHDIGTIDQAVLIFGGCYSNLQATRALYDWANNNGFAANQCICTGDMVAYAANPVETVELIREWGVHVIKGNCEQSLAEQADDCGCGFTDGSTCDVLARSWYQFADNQISDSQREWFAALPEFLTFTLADMRFKVVHGAVSSINRFMFASMPANDYADEFSLASADVVIAGHSGIPFTRKFGNYIWHNSGAIGMPANDGQSDTWFSVIAPEEDGGFRIDHHTLSYDFDAAHSAMIDVELTQGYQKALVNGFWPSMDVLPETERQAQGLPLSPLADME